MGSILQKLLLAPPFEVKEQIQKISSTSDKGPKGNGFLSQAWDLQEQIQLCRAGILDEYVLFCHGLFHTFPLGEMKGGSQVLLLKNVVENLQGGNTAYYTDEKIPQRRDIIQKKAGKPRKGTEKVENPRDPHPVLKEGEKCICTKECIVVPVPGIPLTAVPLGQRDTAERVVELLSSYDNIEADYVSLKYFQWGKKLTRKDGNRTKDFLPDPNSYVICVLRPSMSPRRNKPGETAKISPKSEKAALNAVDRVLKQLRKGPYSPSAALTQTQPPSTVEGERSAETDKNDEMDEDNPHSNPLPLQTSSWTPVSHTAEDDTEVNKHGLNPVDTPVFSSMSTVSSPDIRHALFPGSPLSTPCSSMGEIKQMQMEVLDSEDCNGGRKRKLECLVGDRDAHGDNDDCSPLPPGLFREALLGLPLSQAVSPIPPDQSPLASHQQLYLAFGGATGFSCHQQLPSDSGWLCLPRPPLLDGCLDLEEASSVHSSGQAAGGQWGP